nr:hypothetical protein [Melaminivora jejuensis]
MPSLGGGGRAYLAGGLWQTERIRFERQLDFYLFLLKLVCVAICLRCMERFSQPLKRRCPAPAPMLLEMPD